MNTLFPSIVSLVLVATVVAVAGQESSAAAVLALGLPFALFANVMACESPGPEPELEG